MNNLSFIIAAILVLCAFAIILSVLNSFFDEHPNKVKKESRSVVETGTMFLFFIFYYGVIKLNIGTINIFSDSIRVILALIGTAIVIIGTYVNVKGRLELGQDWANQIKIYQHHRLHVSGMFAIVRHPLYASLIWIFIGGAIIFQNIFALLLNIFVFIPFMYYRAKQEEKLLCEVFPEYKKYQHSVYMFIPKIKK
jgi:protein-S-isoprenylcysteine O-methyltransferase Ste14